MAREWFLDTDRERVRLALPAEPMPSIFVRAALDRWLQDPAALRALVSMAEYVAPERDHRTHIDDADGIQRLRETLVTAFARGTLVVEAIETAAAALARAPKSSGASPGKSAKSPGAAPTGAKSKSGLTSGDAGTGGSSPNPIEDPTGWFEVTVVDAWGEPIGDLDLEISYAGARKKLTTPSNGRVRLEKVDASFGSARILDAPAARDLVRPRFLKKPPPTLPALPNPTQVALTDDLDTVPLTSEVPKTIVVVKPLTRVRLLGAHFDTNKSFLRKTAVPGLQRVYREYQKLGKGNVLVVGHTDTVADDQYNLDLSLERAEAVKAYLRDDVPSWEHWFDETKPDKKRWGNVEIAHMISALPCEPSVAGFQTFSNATRGTTLKVDGKAGPLTRKALIEAYMALPETSLPHVVGVEVHGLGEFFPATEDKSDNLESEENRRVEMFCFDDAIQPPVPGKKGKKGEPEYPQWKGQVTETIDVGSEGVDVRIPLFDRLARILPHTPFRLEIDGEVVLGESDEHGVAHAFRPKPPVQCKVRWSRKRHPQDAPGAPPLGSSHFEFSLEYRIDAASGSSDEQVAKRLRNLGYRAATARANIEDFQLDHGLRPTGVAAHIEDLLREEHDQAKVAPRKDDTPAPSDPSPHGPADDPSAGALPVAPDVEADDCPFQINVSGPDEGGF